MSAARGEPPGRAPALERPAVAIALLGAALLGTCGALGLFEPTETRYAEIAREMLASGDWLSPRLDGIHHFHKPPLAYWAAAAGMALAGVNEWGARLPAALAALLAIAATAWAASRRLATAAVPAGRVAWVLGSMLLFAVVGRALSTDPFLAASVALYWALAPSPWALAALGAGFLAKGPVVFVHTALPVLAVALLGRDRRALAWLGPPRGWLAFAALALPWYLAMVAAHRGLLEYFLADQIWGRVATTVHERGGPPWYFAAVLLGGALPWTPALLVGLTRAWRDRARIETRLTIAWLLAPVAFLSFSGSKLPAYLLPCLPAAALLAARGLDSRVARWGAAVTLAALGATGLALGGAELARLAGSVAPGPLPPLAVAACATLLVASVAAARGATALAGLLTALALATLGPAAAPYDSALGSPRRVAQRLAEMRRGEPVAEIGHFNAGLPFYLGERVPLVEVRREAGFEGPGQASATLAPRDSLAAWAIRHGRVWTFGPERHAREIADHLGLDYEPVARWRKESLGVLTPKP